MFLFCIIIGSKFSSERYFFIFLFKKLRLFKIHFKKRHEVPYYNLIIRRNCTLKYKKLSTDKVFFILQKEIIIMLQVLIHRLFVFIYYICCQEEKMIDCVYYCFFFSKASSNPYYRFMNRTNALFIFRITQLLKNSVLINTLIQMKIIFGKKQFSYKKNRFD